MIRFTTKSHLEWTVEGFIQAFSEELEVRESHFPVTKMPQQGRSFGRTNIQNKQNQDTTGKTAAAAALVTIRDNGDKCVYCLDKAHSSEEYEKVKPVEHCKTLLLKCAKCFNCLKGGHRVFKCRSSSVRRFCKGITALFVVKATRIRSL